jgi:hypothetical protein
MENRKDIIQKVLIECYILGANENKYHQTEGHSKLQKGKILQDIGFMGSGSSASHSILVGTYNTPVGTDQCTKQFLDKLKTPQNAAQLYGLDKGKRTDKFQWFAFWTLYTSLDHPQIPQLLYKFPHTNDHRIFCKQTPQQGTDVLLLKKKTAMMSIIFVLLSYLMRKPI